MIKNVFYQFSQKQAFLSGQLKDLWTSRGGCYKVSFLSHPKCICLHSNKLVFELLYGLFSSVVWICNKRNKSEHYPESSQRSRTLGTGTPALASAFIILLEQREMSSSAGSIEIFLKLFFWIKISTSRN